MTYKWSKTQGYEVSSRGDKRFSAFNAIMPDGRSCEAWVKPKVVAKTLDSTR